LNVNIVSAKYNALVPVIIVMATGALRRTQYQTYNGRSVLTYIKNSVRNRMQITLFRNKDNLATSCGPSVRQAVTKIYT
jgi:hypothetical protein